MPLYCAGAKVLALYPVSIPAHGAALNITVQSYVDHLQFGLTADRRAVPDVDKIADYIVAEGATLTAALR
jgi:diacylglycerol O-acyltransferase